MTITSAVGLSGDEVIAAMRRETDTVLLAFSTGKDSIAAWLALRPHFRVIPFYLWLIPGLAFVERNLRYYEDWFDTPIIRYPSDRAFNNLRSGTLQAPDNWLWLSQTPLPATLTREFVEAVLREEYGLPPETWVATGVRAADSPLRLAAMRKHGAVSLAKRKFHPVFDWNKQRMMETIHRSGVRLPPDYILFGRSWDGIDRRFSSVIRAVYPEDYEIIRAYYPLIEVEDYRELFGRRHDMRGVV